MIARKNFFLSILMLTLTAALVFALSRRSVPQVVQINLENLPYNIAGLSGVEDRFPALVYEELKADSHVYRHYRAANGSQVDLYIGYYGTAKGGRTGHNPYACLPGSGWAIVEKGAVEARPAYRPEGVRLNYVVASKDGVNNVMLHWYQSAGTQVLASGWQQNIHRFMGRVLHNRNDGAYVQISAFTGEANVAAAKVMIEQFAAEVLALLPAHWPVEE